MTDDIAALHHMLRVDAGLRRPARPVLVVTRASDAPILRRVRHIGMLTEREAEIFTALAAIVDDPAGWAGLIICCDDYGGLTEGLRAHGLLGDAASNVPVILVATQCGGPGFPEQTGAPYLLKLPAEGPERLTAGH
jgi:hypothetical protein